MACHTRGMTKTEAVRLFGGRPIDLARAVGVTRQAVQGWPEQLTPKQSDRVQAALWRVAHGIKAEAKAGA